MIARTRETNLLLALILGSGLAVAVAVRVVLGRLLLPVAALLALVVVVLRGHGVCVCRFECDV